MTELVAPALELARLPTGVAGFDCMLHGGFFQGGLSIVWLCGE
jgi:KaiC/GvpD/RAD55 family RecA-like ATPase